MFFRILQKTHYKKSEVENPISEKISENVIEFEFKKLIVVVMSEELSFDTILR
jgi:hypothetical protein